MRPSLFICFSFSFTCISSSYIGLTRAATILIKFLSFDTYCVLGAGVTCTVDGVPVEEVPLTRFLIIPSL